MRVMLVNQHFPPQFLGGSERSVQSLARELTAMGDQVSIVARSPTPRPPVPVTIRERLPDDSRLYRLHGGEFHIERFLRHHKQMEREFTVAMLARQPEVLHFNHLKSLSPGFVEIAVKLGAAIVISLHDFYFACPLTHLQKKDGSLCAGPVGGRECAATCFKNESNAFQRWTARATYFGLVLSLAQQAVCYSDYVASYFTNYGVPSDRMKVLPLGISSANHPAPHYRAPEQPLSLAYCGSVIRHKGPHVILEALKLANLPAVYLTILGPTPDQPYVDEMNRLAQTIAGLTLRFHGAYNWPQLSELLTGIDCVVSPTLVAETFGLVPREALVRGIPVVVSRLGALPEIVVEGDNGFTFDPRDPLELSRIFTRMVDHPQLLPRLIRGARLTQVQTPAGHAAAMREVYRDAIDLRSHPKLDQPSILSGIHQQYQKLLQLDFQ